MLTRLLGVAFAAALASVASAATFNVTTPAEFQTALTTAQANGEPDTINVAAGTYSVVSNGTLTYTAVATENFGLTIDGVDSDTRILTGAMVVPILRIDTTAVINDGGVSIEVRNMTFQSGNAVGTPDDGGALAILTAESLQPNEFATLISVTGSEFYLNRADGDGGAIYIRGHAVEGIYLSDLTVNENQAGGDGGGAYVAGGQFTTPVSLSDIDFFSNLAAGNGGGLLAGGFDPDTASEDRVVSVSLYDMLFYNNVSQSLTGGGGGADVSALDVTVEIVGFVDNTADTGGGLRVRPSFTTLAMVNSGFVGNTADDQGGGLAAGPSVFASVTLTNNTFFANAATNRGGGASVAIDNGSSFARFHNNIIWGNIGSFDSDDLFVDNNALDDIPAVVDVFNNIITEFLVTPGPVSSGSNIDADPTFVDILRRPEPDPRLWVGSPAIDAGDDAAPARPATDFEFDARPFDGDGDMTATTDIGMDEFTGAVVQNADLAVTKTDTPDPVTEGGNVLYTIVVTNNGPGDATNVSLVDTLDELVAFVSATPTQGACGANLGTVSCDLMNLGNGSSATVTISVTTPDVPDTTVITNTVTVSATETDPVSTNDSATEQTTVVPIGPAMADLALTKSDSPDPVFSGGPTITYTLTITNNGPDDASNVVLTDTLPVGVVFGSSTTTAGTCAELDGVVTCDLGGLILDASATVTIVVTPDVVVDATAITNNASVTATEEDPSPVNNTVAEMTTVNAPVADISVSISSAPAEPLINEQITYDITVSNAGPSDDTGVVLIVVVPATTTLDSVIVSQGSCDVKMDTIICTIGDLAAGESVAAGILVTGPSEAMILTLSASVDGDISDPVMANNSVSQDVAVIDVIDLVIQGQSKGDGALGWMELLLLVAVASLVGLRARRQHLAQHTRAMSAAFIGLFSAAALISADDVLAQDWYVGVSVGTTNLDYSASDLTNDLSSLGWTINNPSVDDSNDAWKYYAGFQVNDWFAVEAGYVDLGEVITEFGATITPNEIDPLLSDTFSVHPYQGDGWIAAGVGRWTIAPEQFFIIGRAGLFAWESKTEVRVIQGGTGSVTGDDSGTDAMLGIGIEWQFDQQWSLTVDWERYKLNEWLDVPSIGIKFRF
jgi:uncharacterized repeat protein (TIGR01451 family)